MTLVREAVDRARRRQLEHVYGPRWRRALETVEHDLADQDRGKHRPVTR